MSNWQSTTASSVFELPGIQSKPDVVIGTDGSIHLVYHDADLNKVMYTKGTWSSAGIDEAHLSSFSVSPNPVHDVLKLEGIGNEETYSIMNTQGTIVLQGSGNEVHVEQLSSGLYFAQIDGYQQEKFVVK